LNAARELPALPVEKLTTLRSSFEGILLLLAGAVGERVVLGELQVDQPGTNNQHPEGYKSRDEECAAWRDIRSGF
jgi:hypothetical protein